MELEQAIKLLTDIEKRDYQHLKYAEEGERYFRGDNDITIPEKIPKPWLINTQDHISNPLRNANNRIPCTYYNYLVIQKAVYNFGERTKFKTGNDSTDKEIDLILGSHWNKVCKNLSINASNCSIAWLHTWVDEDNKLHFGVVDSKQIKPIWGGFLNQELILLLREYVYRDDETGELYDVIEIWDDEKCSSFKKKSLSNYSELEYNYCYSRFSYELQAEEPTNEYVHGFSKIPFSAFYNNSFHINDLKPIKGYIDAYDKAFSLFMDNLEDVQQIIFVFENMGGANLKELKKSLKEEGAIKVINNDKMHTGIETITIEIPTTATETMLNWARKNIFEQGQGVDPDPQNYAGNSSGEARKYMYANLDQKCIALKDEFAVGFEHFIGLVLEYLHSPIKKEDVEIQWGAPTKINNVSEIITNLVNSSTMLSEETLLDHHPYVENTQEELERLEKQRKENNEQDYPEVFDEANKKFMQDQDDQEEEDQK